MLSPPQYLLSVIGAQSSWSWMLLLHYPKEFFVALYPAGSKVRASRALAAGKGEGARPSLAAALGCIIPETCCGVLKTHQAIHLRSRAVSPEGGVVKCIHNRGPSVVPWLGHVVLCVPESLLFLHKEPTTPSATHWCFNTGSIF